MLKKHLSTICYILLAIAAFSWAIPYSGKPSRYDFGQNETKQEMKQKIIKVIENIRNSK